jgi:hypothetical protein
MMGAVTVVAVPVAVMLHGPEYSPNALCSRKGGRGKVGG